MKNAKRLSIALFAAVAIVLLGGCLYLPQERVTYTLNPLDGAPAAGSVSLNPAEPTAEIHAYLKTYSGSQSTPKMHASRLNSVSSVCPLKITDGNYSIKPKHKRTWILISFGAWTWRFPAADIVFLADGREPMVVPLGTDADSLSYMAGILRPVPQNISLVIPQDPSEWERKIDALFLPDRDDFYGQNKFSLIAGAIKQDALREFALKAYADMLEKFPEYQFRERVEKKIEVLKSPSGLPREGSEAADGITALFLQNMEMPLASK